MAKQQYVTVRIIIYEMIRTIIKLNLLTFYLPRGNSHLRILESFLKLFVLSYCRVLVALTSLQPLKKTKQNSTIDQKNVREIPFFLLCQKQHQHIDISLTAVHVN